MKFQVIPSWGGEHAMCHKCNAYVPAPWYAYVTCAECVSGASLFQQRIQHDAWGALAMGSMIAGGAEGFRFPEFKPRPVIVTKFPPQFVLDLPDGS